MSPLRERYSWKNKILHIKAVPASNRMSNHRPQHTLVSNRSVFALALGSNQECGHTFFFFFEFEDPDFSILQDIRSNHAIYIHTNIQAGKMHLECVPWFQENSRKVLSFPRFSITPQSRDFGLIEPCKVAESFTKTKDLEVIFLLFKVPSWLPISIQKRGLSSTIPQK